MVDLSRSVFCWRKSISSLEIFDCDFPMIMFLENAKNINVWKCVPPNCVSYIGGAITRMTVKRI